MIRKMTFGLCLVLALTTTLTAQPGKAKVPLGTWVREAGTAKLEFKFEEKQLTVTLKDGDKGFTVEADYSIAKDGTIFGRIAKVTTVGGGNGPENGMLFSFKAKQAKSTLTISDLTGTDSAEARNAVEGDYTLQPKKD